MAISKDERALSYAIKDPRFPVATVEGEYDGERAVFLCLVDQDEKTEKVDLTPVAMLLREEDIPKVTREPEATENRLYVPVSTKED